MTKPQKKRQSASSRTRTERPVSLSPLDARTAIRGLFAIPNPDATKPKRKKAPPPPKE
jgi:hypothetical protein